MKKWFQRSLAALGALFIIIIPIAIMANDTNNAFLDTIGIGMMLIAFVLIVIAAVTGIGTAFQWFTNRSSIKAKRGMSYEDEMLNRIMSRLDDEERAYLQGYLSAQSYEPLEESYIIDERKQDYR